MADDIKDPKELKEAQEAMDKYIESLKNLHTALDISPNEASLAFQIMLSYDQTREYKKAEEMIDKALSLYPDNQDNLVLKSWYKYYDHKDFTLLVDELKSLRSQYEDVDRYITFNVVDALFRSREYNLALSELEIVEDTFYIGQTFYTPTKFLIGRAQALMNRKQDAQNSYKQAAKLLEKELLKNPRDIRISSDLALVYSYLNRKDDALRMIESAMSEVPIEKDYTDHGDYFNKEIEINLVSGNLNKALTMIERSSEIFGGLGYFDLLHPKWDSLRDSSKFKSVQNNLNPNI